MKKTSAGRSDLPAAALVVDVRLLRSAASPIALTSNASGPRSASVADAAMSDRAIMRPWRPSTRLQRHPTSPATTVPVRPPAPSVRITPKAGVHLRRDPRARRAPARRLRERGFGHGHRVAVLLENRPEFFFHYLALNALGCAIVPINPDYRNDELRYQMEHSEADLAVVVSARVPDLEVVARARSGRSPSRVGRWPTRCRCTRAPRGGEPGADASAACSILRDDGTPERMRATNFYYRTPARGIATSAALCHRAWA